MVFSLLGCLLSNFYSNFILFSVFSVSFVPAAAAVVLILMKFSGLNNKTSRIAETFIQLEKRRVRTKVLYTKFCDQNQI